MSSIHAARAGSSKRAAPEATEALGPGKRPRAIPEPSQEDSAGSAPREYRLEPGSASKSAELDRHWGVAVPMAENASPVASSPALPPPQRSVASAVDLEASNEAFECVMVGGAEYFGDSEDISPACRDFLPDVWVPACIVAVLIYVGTLTLVQAQWIPSEHARASGVTLPLHDAKYSATIDPYFAWVAELCAVAFLASAARNLGTLAFMRRGSSQTSVLICVTLINLVAAHAHWLMAYGIGPVYDSCFGRRMHAARFAEWLSMVFLLAVVMNALDCPSWFDLARSTSPLVIAAVLGFASTFTCQLWGPLQDGECPWLEGSDVGSGVGDASKSSISSSSFCSSSNYTSAAFVNEGHWKHRGVSGPNDNVWWSPTALARSSGAQKLQLFLLLLGVVCYVDSFRVLKRRAARQPLSTAATAPAQALLFTLWASITWSLYVVIYFMSIFHPPWFTSTHEDVANCIVDLLAKFLFANVLSEAHLWHSSPEEEVRAELKLKESANDAQRHFLRYVFHEVRVPLNTIRLGIDSIQQGSPLEPETSFVVSCMDEAVNTMSETLNDVLSYQKIEEGKVELVPGPFAINEFMRAVTSGFEAIVQSKSLKLEQESDSRVPPELVGDALRLRQVLNNFISNAIKFTGEGGDITLRSRLIGLAPPNNLAANESPATSPSSAAAANLGNASTSVPPVLGDDEVDTAAVQPGSMATVEFSVTDTGIGIAPEDQRKLFQAFSQIRTGDLQSGRGSGLGLSICKHMIHLMGGSIGLRSRPGQGSTFFFTVTLPVAAPGSATPRPNSQSRSECAGSVRPNQFLRSKGADDVSPTGSNSGLQRSMARGSTANNLTDEKSGNGAKVALATSSKVVADPASATVLIVDDVTMNRKMIKRCVQQLGFVCDEACDGAEAVTMCGAKHYSLVLMDNVMPHMNGMEAAAAIRRNDAVDGWSGTRIFGLTGNALSEDVAEFQRAGCDEVLTKPLRFDHFKQLLTAYGLFEESK